MLKCENGVGERICYGVGIDVSAEAIKVAKQNAKNLRLARDNVRFAKIF